MSQQHGSTIKEQWDSFDVAVTPKNAPAVQRQEMRRAFYAGAQSMLTLLCDIGDDAVSEEAGVERLEQWRQEIGAFAKDLQEGRV